MSHPVLDAFAIPIGEGVLHIAGEASQRQVLCIGEQSHGTEEFYQIRCDIARKFIELQVKHEKVFIVLELSFALSVAINAYVKGEATDVSFSDEFPQWMWDNCVMRSFFRWMREHGDHELEVVGCDLYQDDLSKQQLLDGPCKRVPTPDEAIEAGHYANKMVYLNASVVADAAQYRREHNSWNVRDGHMAAVVEYLLMAGNGKVVFMAHNSHVVDYRATSHLERGEQSVGQLVRETLGDSAYIVMQSTFSGTVRAAKEWGLPGQEFEIEKPASSSVSHLLHQCVHKNFVVDFSQQEVRNVPMTSRAIGVVYKQGNENLSHYFEGIHSQMGDAIVHVDESNALKI